MRIAYIFTTFPKLSERFFLREVVELRRQGLEFDLYSIIGGADESEAGPVTRMRWTDWLIVWAELLYWFLAKPKVVVRFLGRLNPFVYRSAINWAENALGLAFAIRFARRFRGIGYRFGHGTWATAPGMTVWALEGLIGLAYTLEAHAYDVWRDGGDAFLDTKLIGAKHLRSSTDATAKEMERRMALRGSARSVVCVRRGLESIPSFRVVEPSSTGVLKVLSVGRLIEKKGYSDQLEIFAVWRRRGVRFEAKIIGEGPLMGRLRAKAAELDLGDLVEFCGRLEHEAVDRAYCDADLFLFCGQVSESGDRDGFPNVIGEAMSHSVVVFSSDVSGTTEGVVNMLTGYIIEPGDCEQAAMQIYFRMQSEVNLGRVRVAAYDWICREFSIQRNAAKLRRSLWL